MSKTRQMLIEGYIESLEQEQIPWRKGWGNGDSQHNPITNTFYRGINLLLLNYKYDERRYEDPSCSSTLIFFISETFMYFFPSLSYMPHFSNGTPCPHS